MLTNRYSIGTAEIFTENIFNIKSIFTEQQAQQQQTYVVNINGPDSVETAGTVRFFSFPCGILK
jgi:hypothetical protein